MSLNRKLDHHKHVGILLEPDGSAKNVMKCLDLVHGLRLCPNTQENCLTPEHGILVIEGTCRCKHPVPSTILAAKGSPRCTLEDSEDNHITG